MEESSANRKGKNWQGESTLPVICRAGINHPTFRILLIGPEDVMPVLAKRMKEGIADKYNIRDIVLHYAVSLNEDIAKRLHDNGVHGIVLCTNASKSTTKTNIPEILKYLDFDLASTSLYILNLVQPSPAISSSVADAIEKLSIAYNTPLVNILLEDEESVKFGLDRVCTAALRGAKFIYGYEPPSLRGVDFCQLRHSFQ